MGLAISKLTRLMLGLPGESNSRTIKIDVTDWLQEWPGGVIGLMVCRPGEDTYYPANVKVENGILKWTPTRADVLISGKGMAQFILTDDNDVEMRSRTVETIIGESIPGTEGEAPAPEAGWVHEVLQAAEDAREAVDKMPTVGENGNWMLWDAEAGAFVDSGISAGGQQSGDNEIVLLEETALVYVEEQAGYILTTPWATAPTAGMVCTVTYNGAEYECEALDISEMAGVKGAVLLGNGETIGLEGNADAPFTMLCFPEPNNGMYAAVMALDSAESVTVGVVTDVRGYVDSEVAKVNAKIEAIPEPEPEVLTVTADYDGTASNFSHTYEEISAAMQAGKVVQLVLDYGDGMTICAPAIIRNEDSHNSRIYFQFLLLAFSQAVTVSYNGKTGEITTETVEINLESPGTGENGVGIQSIEQTTTSTTDGGENIITATLTDGTTSTFKIKNGSKGSNGETGPAGVGIASIEQTTTSTANGGDNVFTVTLTNGDKATFTVKNGTMEETKLEDLSNVEVHDTTPTELVEGNWYLVKVV